MILIGCSEVGQAKYLSDVIKSLDYKCTFIASNICFGYFQDTNVIGFKEKDYDRINFKEIKLVICGSPFCNKKNTIERRLIKKARSSKIVSISIIEHWSWYKKRFQINGKNALFPDHVILNDNVAYNEALAEGLPRKCLKPLGNIYLENLSKAHPTKLNQSKIKFKYKLPKNKNIIFFVSEKIKNGFNKKYVRDLGYDEFTVLNDIKSILTQNDHLVIKTHPEENIKKFKMYENKQISVISDCSIYEIITMSNQIIGMTSMLLIELAMFRNDIISYIPNNKKKFIGSRIGATINVRNISKTDYKLNLKKYRSFKRNYYGSKKRLINFINQLI